MQKTVRIALLFVAWHGLSLAQDPFNTSKKLTSVAQMLRDRHVETSREGLMDALNNPDPSVRSLAAQELALERAQDAILNNSADWCRTYGAQSSGYATPGSASLHPGLSSRRA